MIKNENENEILKEVNRSSIKIMNFKNELSINLFN